MRNNNTKQHEASIISTAHVQHRARANIPYNHNHNGRLYNSNYDSRTHHQHRDTRKNRNRNVKSSSSSFDDYNKLRELESVITSNHSTSSTTTTTSSPHSSNFNKRLSSTPPRDWSIPPQYPRRSNFNTNNSTAGGGNITQRIYASRSIAQLIDVVYLEKDENNNINNHHNQVNDRSNNVESVDAISPHVLIKLWEKLALLVKDSSTAPEIDQQLLQKEGELNHRLATILNHTINALPQCHPGQVRSIAFAMGTIVKAIGSYSTTTGHHRQSGSRGGGEGNHYGKNVDQIMILHNQLVKSNNAILFWNTMQHQVLQLSIDNFRPKMLVSIAWSLATMSETLRKKDPNRNSHHQSSNGNTNPTLNVTPFFQALQTTFHKRRTEFSSKHLGNLAWSTMTCRVNDNSNSSILHDFANEFISRRNNDSSWNDDDKGSGLRDDDEDGIDPMTLCQWASSYAKAGHKDEDLFRTIASVAIPMLMEQKFDMRYLANLAYAFALAELPSSSSSSSPKMMNDGDSVGSSASASYLSALFDTIAAASMEKLPTFTTQNFANIVWAYAKVEHPHPALFDGVAKESIPRLRDFSSQELAMLAWAFSKFHSDQHPETNLSLSPSSLSSEIIFDRIAEEVSRRGLKSFTLQGVAMLAHSFATVGHTTNTTIWDAIDEIITTRQRELGNLECSHIARSYAMIGRRSDDIFRGIESIVLSKVHQFKPSGLSSLAWAYATLGYDVPDLYVAISKQSLQCLDEFNRVDEVMLVLALSRIDLPLPDIRDQIFARSTLHLSEYMSLDLFNMLIFYVRAGYKSDHWMEAMANEIIHRSPSTFPPKMAVSIAHSYASVGCRNPALLNYLLRICQNRLEELEPKEAASLAWSFASLEFFDRKFFGALADSCEGRWHEFDAASLATMAWAYATAREDRPELFEGIMDASIVRVDDFSAQGVSMLLWACSTAGYSNQRLFHSFEEAAEMVLHECDSQSLANIAWAYTVAGFDSGTLFGPKFIAIVAESFDAFNHQGLCQLHQWSIWRKNIGSDAALPPHIEKRCYDEFRTHRIHRSKLQIEIISELASMGIRFDEESCTKSGFSLDVLVDVNGTKIALEVDGPHHFVGRKLTGNSMLKHRQIAAVDGISVVSLPYWELNSLKTSDEKQKYLRLKLGLNQA